MTDPLEPQTKDERRRDIVSSAVLALEEVADDYGLTSSQVFKMCVEEYEKFGNCMAGDD